MTQHDQKASRGRRPKLQLLGTISLSLIIIAYSCGATAITAARLNYDVALGPKWAGMVYPPFDWVIWSFRFYDAAPEFFGYAYITFVSIFALAVLIIVTIIAVKTRSAKPQEGLLGTSAFLRSVDELRAEGVLPQAHRKRLFAKPSSPASVGPSGPYLAGVTDSNGRLHYIRATRQEHVGIIAPTRQGKGVGPVNMTALSYSEGFIAIDPKGELFNVSAGFRATLGPVWNWNPVGRENCSRFNFLDKVRPHDLGAVGDAMSIATLLVDPSSVGDWDHWKSTGFDFLSGLILHVIYERLAERPPRRASLADVAKALGDPKRPNAKLYKEMAENRWGQCDENGDWIAGIPNDKIAQAGQAMLDRADDERSSVHSVAATSVNLYTDPIIAANAAVSDFQITDIFNAERPGSLYIRVSPADEITLRPILRMMLAFIVRTVEGVELKYENGQPLMPWKHRTLMLLDEFASLGMVKEIELALSRIAGYGVQLMLIIQDNNQLFQSYTQYQTILGGLQTKLVFSPNDEASAEWLSKSLGTMTAITKDVTVSGNRFGGMLGQVSETYHHHDRPLLTPQECKRLKPPKKDKDDRIVGGGEVIILRTNLNPIFAEQILYFRDPYFVAAARKAPPTDLDRNRRRKVNTVIDHEPNVEAAAHPGGDQPNTLKKPERTQAVLTATRTVQGDLPGLGAGQRR